MYNAMKKINKVNINNKNGKLNFNSSRGGKLVDITNETRAALINTEELTKNIKPVYKSLYIIKHKLIIPMARLEDKNIDGIYIKRNNKHIIFIDPKSSVDINL